MKVVKQILPDLNFMAKKGKKRDRDRVCLGGRDETSAHIDQAYQLDARLHLPERVYLSYLLPICLK